MADDSPQQSQNPQSKSQTIKIPNPIDTVSPAEKQKLGTFVERFRSFESDMARLKGIKLDPVVPEKPAVEFSKPEKPEQNFLDIAGKPEPYVEANGHTAEIINAAKADLPPIHREDPQTTIHALHKDDPIQQIRTIHTDVAQSLHEQRSTIPRAPLNSTTSPAVTQAQRPVQSQRVVIEDPKRSFLILGISGILIAGGLIALGGFYLIKTRPKPPTPVVVNEQIVIPTDRSKNVVLAGDQSLASLIAEAKNNDTYIKPEMVKLVVKDGNRQINTEEFLTKLSPTIPDWFVRSLDPAVYLAAIYNGGNGWHPVFVFKIESYENGYAGMLKWEETIANEFKVLMPQYSQAPVAATTSTAKATPMIFKDIVVRNKDVRSLQDGFGRQSLLYSFADADTLVITTDQAALEEAFSRLTTSKFVR
jgi:hypothetical protein